MNFVCECCNYSTTEKSNHQRHIKSARHIKRAEAAEAKNKEQQIAEITAKLDTLVSKEEVLLMTVPPTTVGETCNPVYIMKQMNDDPDNHLTPDIDEFFSFRNEDLAFEFGELELADIPLLNTEWVMTQLTTFVTGLIQQKIKLPFKYYKSSWYIKYPVKGWEKCEEIKNKSLQVSHKKYIRHILVQKLIYILRHRFITYFDDKTKSTHWRSPFKDTGYTELESGILAVNNYSNQSILGPMSGLFHQ
jgi:hypothetical protein